MWVIPPLPPGASRADRLWHRREVKATERELKDVWTNACLVTHLAQVIPPPGAILQTPPITTITLDSVPARFTVRLRPGQVLGDVVKRAGRLAVAFRVPAIEVVPLTAYDNHWISVRLMEPVWIEWPDEYVLESAAVDEPTTIDEPQPALTERIRVQHAERTPAGGPRSMRRGRHRSHQLRSGTEEAPASAFGSVLRFLNDFWRLPESETPKPVEPRPS